MPTRLNQITTYSDRFGANPDLLTQFCYEQSPRIGEISSLVSLVNLMGSARVLNIPSESNLLDSLAPNWQIDKADFEVSSQMEAAGIKKTCSSLSGFENNTYDAIIGIVPLHHLTDQEQIEFIKAAKRKLTRGGCFVIAEPLRGSSVSLFLDTQIDRYSSTGHKGNYPTKGLVEAMAQVGFKCPRMKTVDCGLFFSSEEEMFDWFGRCFGIKFPRKKIFLEDIKNLLGLQNAGKSLRYGWELTFFIAEA
jgi:SAM-dependent methyltransferase